MRHFGGLRRNRRAVSTLIGIAFFILLYFVSMASFVGLYNNFLSYNQAVASSTQANAARSTERVDITAAYLSSSKNLVLNMTNKGSTTAHLVGLRIINQTANTHYFFNTTHPTTPFNFFMEPGSTLNYVSSVSLTSGNKYSIRVVTENGNSFSIGLVPAVQARLALVAPAGVLTSQKDTVALHITNNDTSNNYVFNLRPTLTSTAGTIDQ